jgi:hypothetical protein
VKAKHKAIATADRAASSEWKRLMLHLTHNIALRHDEFTADDVFEAYEALPGQKPVTHEPRAFGAVILAAVKQGLCENTGRMLESRRKHVHRSKGTVWRSLLRNPGGGTGG